MVASYQIDSNDAVVRLPDIPPIDVGAPLPQVYAAEHELELSYYVAKPEGAERDRIAVVKFRQPRAHFLGPPNEDDLQCHPLHPRGLDWYAGQEVQGSSWIRRLSLDSQQYRHFIFTFHDSTFECIAENYEIEVKDADS